MAGYSTKSLAVAALAIALSGAVTFAQKFTPADAAAKLTGTWQINFELSPQFAPRGGAGAAAPGARGGQQQYFSAGMSGAARTAPNAFQRGGGGGRGGGAAAGPVSDEDRAGRAFIGGLRQVATTLTFKASADSVTISNGREERTYAVDNKSTKVDVNGATVTMKSRWDNRTLKQEFVYGEDRITHDYELNAEGTRINFKMVSSNMGNPGPPTEGKAVYDKKP